MASPATEVIRISSALKRSAEREGEVFNRKAAQQIEFWAEIGRNLERLGHVSLEQIRKALLAKANPDDLSPEETAVYYTWLDELDTRATFPSMAEHKHAAGLAYTALDDAGQVVRIHPDGRTEILSD